MKRADMADTNFDSWLRESVGDNLNQFSSNGYFVEQLIPNLFKYRDLTGYALDEILNNAATLTRIDQLNDVFEGMRWNAFSDNLNRDVHPKVAEIEDCIGVLARTQGTYVGCFSQIPDSILMWSHYACGSEGICVEYDFSSLQKDATITKYVFPIYYSQRPFNISHISNSDDVERSSIFLEVACGALTKSDIWSYEKEWRILYFAFLAEHDKKDRISLSECFEVVPRIKSVTLGYHFLRKFWRSGNDDLIKKFMQVLDYIKSVGIDVYYMNREYRRFEFNRKHIDVDVLKEFMEKYVVNSVPYVRKYGNLLLSWIVTLQLS